MTEIEQALLDALESLQREHEQQLNGFSATLQTMRNEHEMGSQLWADTARGLRVQYEQCQVENRALLQRVQRLSEQVGALQRQVIDCAQRVEHLTALLVRLSGKSGG